MAGYIHVPTKKQLNHNPEATEEEKAQRLKQQQYEEENM